MHVRRIVISHYGPLQPLDQSLTEFTVFRGPNERGKTLMIDALVKMLFKDALKRPQQKLFGNLGRVDERPEGFLLMATHGGEVKIGAADSISRAAPAGVEITPEDFRNVFLIRDSDLALKNEEAYYGRVSERLCGTRSATIERLKDALKLIGRLRSATPNSPLAVRKDREHKRIGEQVTAAESLLEDVARVASALARDDFDASYRRLADLSDRREQLVAESRQRRAATRRAQFERARVAVTEVRDAMESLAGLGNADDVVLESWRALLVRRETFEHDLADVTARGVELRAARDEARGEWELLRTQAEAMEAQRGRAETELRPDLDRFARTRAEREHADRSVRAVTAVLAVTATLGLVSIAVALATRNALAVGAAFMCTLAAAWCGGLVWRGSRARLELTRLGADILGRAARLGLPVVSVSDVNSALQALERDVTQDGARARDAEVLMRQRESDVAANERNADDKRSQIAESHASLLAVRTQAGVDSVELLAEAVARRRELDAAIRTRLAMLRDWVPAAAATAATAGHEAFLAACEHEIEQVLDDNENAPAFPYEPDAAMRVERELERVTAEE
ncbi:MAG TPA: hypothetical protein VFX92_12680, partial [Candidatus Krumholzibacteria bacterium]|nr:hypothetical protein [Candidatus Krumholzibacteria bacterium]